jgi:hypothetical protein
MSPLVKDTRPMYSGKKSFSPWILYATYSKLLQGQNQNAMTLYGKICAAHVTGVTGDRHA